MQCSPDRTAICAPPRSPHRPPRPLRAGAPEDACTQSCTLRAGLHRRRPGQQSAVRQAGEARRITRTPQRGRVDTCTGVPGAPRACVAPLWAARLAPFALWATAPLRQRAGMPRDRRCALSSSCSSSSRSRAARSRARWRELGQGSAWRCVGQAHAAGSPQARGRYSSTAIAGRGGKAVVQGQLLQRSCSCGIRDWGLQMWNDLVAVGKAAAAGAPCPGPAAGAAHQDPWTCRSWRGCARTAS